MNQKQSINQVMLGTATAMLLVWVVLILIPMAPGGLIDTRDFSALPRWQFNSFNVFLISLGVASLVTAWFALSNKRSSFVAAIVIGCLYIAVFGADLAGVFPHVVDPLPVQLLVLESLDLAAGGALVVVALAGVRQ